VVLKELRKRHVI